MEVMSMVIKIAIVLLVFTVIVTAHEFGHFIMAKRSGVLVKEFAIGMGPKIISKQWGETAYSLRILPIGGYCMMQEEVGDSEDLRSLSSKSVGQRLSILFAGPVMNFLLAFVLMFIIVMAQGQASNVIGEMNPGFPAEQAGMQIEDKIIMVNGIKTKNMHDITKALSTIENNIVEFKINRGGEEIGITLERQYSEANERYLVGFTPTYVKGNIINGIQNGFVQTINLLKMTIDGFVMLLTGQMGVDELAGPVGVITAGVQVWDAGIKESVWFAVQQMFFLGALISVNLGVFNLFPFPALDGGRILFTTIEGVRGKPVDPKIEGFFHVLGFVLIMGLMVFVMYNDIARGIGKQ
ncbi:MAG TPA: RIP metalloprotease RseP [Epulopiscium sp.]|nr:RIP metalloprotease RseP [Candidatus Epulonipiscium sp.]